MPTNDTISSGSAPSSAPSSPRNRFKFLCSHGGKILLRPADGQLKYVGGETRVISVPRDIPFQEVMKRLTYLIDGEMILKYQLVSEELDALVSVRSDEDLVHMFDEIEHYEIAGCPRMRAFLFPVNHGSTESQMEPLPPEQRYIYSINGINNTKLQLGSLASSSCSSPRSPDSCAAAGAAEAVMMMMNTTEHVVLQNNHQNMHKIQSSPSICHNLSIPQQSSHYLQLLPQCYHKSPNPPFDTHRSTSAAVPERLVPIRSVGRPVVDGIRIQVDAAPQYYYASGETNRGISGCCTKCMHHDSCTHFSDRRTIDRQATLP